MGTKRKLPDDPAAPIFLRIDYDTGLRLIEVCRRHTKNRQAVAEAGLLSEIERLEVQAPRVTRAEAQAIAELKRISGSDATALAALQNAIAAIERGKALSSQPSALGL